MLSTAAPAQDRAVTIGSGVTPLADIGIYRVAYQSYGHELVEMPGSWVGHFDGATGISYVPHSLIAGRDALLLHSPWRTDPGLTRVEYRLALPDVRPLSLAFSIAMAPGMVGPNRSDGVTFSAAVIDEGAEHEFLRQHYDSSEWHDIAFDLAPWAGKTVTVRLQVEPGPANNPSFDYSYFGDAKITAGEGGEDKRQLLRRLTETRAYRATRDLPLAALANDTTHGIVPGNLLDCRTRAEQVGNALVLSYEAEDCTVEYRYTPRTGRLDDWSVSVDGGEPFSPASGGGIALIGAGDQRVADVTATLGGVEVNDGARTVRAEWTYEGGGQRARVRWTFGIVGKALTVEASSDDAVIGELNLGNVGAVAMRRTIAVPYLAGSLDYLPQEHLFTCRYLDWTYSHASMCPQGQATYDTKTDGTRNPLRERGYVTVSPCVDEVLPNLPSPPSPYRELLGPRIMLDIWGHHGGTYEGDAENLRDLKDNGVDYLAIISHVWQRYGYDVKLPDHLPANPEFGGDEGMKAFGKAANDCGYVWSLHENYIDLYPDAPSYDPSARVLRADGSPSPAWFNVGTGVQSYGLKCTRALGYAKQNAPEIHRRFGTNAAYLDVHTCVPPWHQLDHEATEPMAAMALCKVERDTELFQYMRDTHGGPLFGEGAQHFYWAGRCDGVEAQVDGGENHAPFLNFDLLKIHPQMVNHGMGYYERWFTRGYQHQLGRDAGSPEQFDKYRAQELAYGHAGFIGASQTDNVQWVAKEHHLMHPVQALYGAARVSKIEYEVEGEMVTASIALALGDRLRQAITYDSGLRLWINWSPEPWEVQGRTLPQWGFLALGPDTEVRTTVEGGVYSDYADCPEYLFVDARNRLNMPYAGGGKDIEPRLGRFEYLGANRVRLSYEWAINDTLDRDYHVFVHFTNAQQTNNAEGIAFQQDHDTALPTSQWQEGQTLVDGPYEITIPEDQPFDSYDVTIGLHSGERVPLRGLSPSGGKILIGRMLVTRENGRVTGVRLGSIDADRERTAAGLVDFSAHLNPVGTMVDFGAVRTDGSLKIEKGEGKLLVLPYPRGVEAAVALDVGAMLGRPGSVRPGDVRIQALAAGTRAPMGDVPCRAEGDRCVFTVGAPGVGAYSVTW